MGLGQVMLQANAITGLLFLIGIFYNSWLLGIAALAGTIVSTVTAWALKYSNEDIKNGLYGFNGALVGIALLFFFEMNAFTLLALIIGAAASTILMSILKKFIPAFTSPFVIVTWVIISLLLFIFDQKLLSGSSASSADLNIFYALFNGFGQVMFQENIITGAIFLLAILVNSGRAAFYSLYASLLGVPIGWLFSIPFSTLNSGLMGYNGILCAIALAGSKRSDFVWISFTIFLSVVIQISLAAQGIITLTAPFVFSTWIVLIIKRIK